MVARRIDAVRRRGLPSTQDLRGDFGPPRDQQELNACPAYAATALMEYFERRFMGFAPPCSVEFVYRNALHFSGRVGNVATDCRTTMKALAFLGTPPESQFRTQSDLPDDGPDPFLDPLDRARPFDYALAANFKPDHYYRLDGAALHAEYPKRKHRGAPLLVRVKEAIACEVPLMFSLYLYAPGGLPALAHATADDGALAALSADYAGAIRGTIAMRASFARNADQHESALGTRPKPTSLPDVVGHTLVACGYDDNYVVSPPASGGAGLSTESTRGALLVRNSWSEAWGQGGYGYVPYDYVRAGLTEDWWTLYKQTWVNSSRFAALGDDNR